MNQSIVAPLLGIPWERMKCGQTAAEGLRRMGMEEAAKYVPCSQEGAEAIVAACLDSGSPWMLVGQEACNATVKGDVIVSSAPEGYHVSVYVGRGRALTSSQRHGVHTIACKHLLGVQGVFRFGGAP